MENLKSPSQCPACRAHRWWTEFRLGGTGAVVLLGTWGEPAFSYCYNCGHQQAGAMEPTPWPKGTKFPMDDPEDD